MDGQSCWYGISIIEWVTAILERYVTWMVQTWSQCRQQSCNWWCLCCNRWLCWIALIIVTIFVAIFWLLLVIIGFLLFVICVLLCLIGYLLLVGFELSLCNSFVSGIIGTSNGFLVGGTVTGATTGPVRLEMGSGSTGPQFLDISGNASFQFPNPVPNGIEFTVQLVSDPPGMTCTIANAIQTISGANVTNVEVTCVQGSSAI